MGLLPVENVRRHLDLLFTDLTSVETTTDSTALAKLHDQYSKEAARYQGEQKDAEDEARRLETEVAMERNRADRFDLSEVFLEIGLVITSITLLSGRRLYWLLGIAFAVAGILIAGTGFFIH